MKNFLTAASLAILLLTGATSCGNSEFLSASSAKKALKKEAIFAKNHWTVNFNTGFYEVDSDGLDKLARLKAAGMITFTVESAVETVTEYSYSWYSGRTAYSVEREHDFVTVALTEKGGKLVVGNPVAYREDMAKIMKEIDAYEEQTPDYMNAFYTRPSADEAVESVVVDEEPGTAEEATDSIGAESVTEEAAPAATTAEVDVNAKYNALCARVHIESNNMLAGRLTLEDVYDVFCPEELAKSGAGSCRFTARFIDKTPFGYVLGDGIPGDRQLRTGKANLRFYRDKGWTVESID